MLRRRARRSGPTYLKPSSSKSIPGTRSCLTDSFDRLARRRPSPCPTPGMRESADSTSSRRRVVARVEPHAREVAARARRRWREIDISLSLSSTMRSRAEVPGVVERLERHAAGQRAVADDRDDRLVAARERRAPRPCRARPRSSCDACPVSKTSYGVSPRFGKPHTPPYCRSVSKRVAAAGEQLVDVALVPDVPDDLVRAGSRARDAARASARRRRGWARGGRRSRRPCR